MKTPSKYPALAWLNGYWCVKKDSEGSGDKSIWHVVGPNQIRVVSYHNNYYGDQVLKYKYTLTVQDDLFEFRSSSTSGSDQFTTILKYKKESDTQITQLEGAGFKNNKKASEYDLKNYFKCRG